MSYKINFKAQDEKVIVVPDIREALRLDISDADANKILMEIRFRLKEQKKRQEKDAIEQQARNERLVHDEEAVKFFIEVLTDLGYTNVVRMKYVGREVKLPEVRGFMPLEKFDGQGYKDAIIKKLKPKLKAIGYLPEDVQFTAEPYPQNKQEVSVLLEVRKA